MPLLSPLRRWQALAALTLVFAGSACAAASSLGSELTGVNISEPKPEETPAEPEKPPEPAVWKSIAGVYQSSYGKITFTESGKDVTGVYPDGKLECVWTGKRFAEYDCTYTDSSGKGKAKLWILESGELTGSWTDGSGRSSSWRFGPGDGPPLDVASSGDSGDSGDSGGSGSSGSSSSAGSSGSSSAGSSSSSSSSSSGCKSDYDCSGSGKMCESGACVPAEGKCKFNSDCGGAKCDKSRCANSRYGRCSLDSDCGKGGKCSSNRCK